MVKGSNCLIIAGEKSGEEHVLSFYPSLKTNCPQVHFWGVGGDELAQQGMELLYHLKDFSSWGFSEVIGKVPFYLRALNNIEEEVKRRKCSTAILVDFQDFNLRLCKRLNKLGVKVLYYVAPQAWAWKAWRAKVLQENVHSLFTIIPFEKQWFYDRGVSKVISVEHPLLRKFPAKDYDVSKDPFKEGRRILLLPGSRNFEVENLLPIFMKTLKKLKDKFDFDIGIVKSPNVSPFLYAPFDKEIDVHYSSEQLHSALLWGNYSLAASGTVTLSTALFKIPTIVCYKTSLLNEFIFNNFLDYKGHISLANIVHEAQVFPEFIQDQVTPDHLIKSFGPWLEDQDIYFSCQGKLAKTKELISGELEDVGRYMAEVIDGRK